DAIAGVMDSLGITRDLPQADAAEVAAAQGPKTKSSPNKTSTPKPALKKTPAPTRAGRTAVQPEATVAQMAPPPPPAKSRMGLIMGAAAAVLVILGGGVYTVLERQAE